MLSVEIRKTLREFQLDVSFDVEPARTLVIIGPSGCGKTTTLNVIAGLARPDDGRIALRDDLLWDRRARVDLPTERRRVGFVFQDFALFPHMSVAANVAYGLRARRAPKDRTARRVEEALSLLGILHLKDRRPGALSGGERQRVALARAIACDAEILLLDEPMGSLDAQTRNRVRGELQVLLQSLGRIAIMVTHDYIDALTFGDRICVMDRGRMLQMGDRQEIIQHPRSHFVAELTGVNFYQGTFSSAQQDGLAEIWVGDTLLTFFPSDVTVARARPNGAERNVFRSRIRDVVHLGDKVRLSLNGSLAMKVEVSASTLDSMQLREGDEVYASVNASAVRTYH
jgi:ABC-type Fe3+/spermidine/putrescine transport system ATPase subunit